MDHAAKHAAVERRLEQELVKDLARVLDHLNSLLAVTLAPAVRLVIS